MFELSRYKGEPKSFIFLRSEFEKGEDAFKKGLQAQGAFRSTVDAYRHSDMNADIEEIHRQLHELRNYLGPVELLLANIEAQLQKSNMEFERRITGLELRLDELAKLVEAQGEKSPAASPYPTRLAPDTAPPEASV